MFARARPATNASAAIRQHPARNRLNGNDLGSKSVFMAAPQFREHADGHDPVTIHSAIRNVHYVDNYNEQYRLWQGRSSEIARGGANSIRLRNEESPRTVRPWA